MSKFSQEHPKIRWCKNYVNLHSGKEANRVVKGQIEVAPRHSLLFNSMAYTNLRGHKWGSCICSLVFERVAKYLILLLTFCSSIVVSKAQYQVLLLTYDSKEPIRNALITDSESGTSLGISDKKGRISIGPRVQRITISHASYQSLDITLPQDTIYLDFAPMQLQEVEILAQKPRYYRLRSAVRVYQYLDSLPINFVEGIVDFYVDTKKPKLGYKALRLDVYTDDEVIKRSSLKKGIVNMSNNSLINWILNEHIASNSEFLVTDTCVYDKKSGVEVGCWSKYPNGVSNIAVDLLAVTGEQQRTMLGLTTTIHKKILEQSFPRGISLGYIEPYDFQMYRLSIELSARSRNRIIPVYTTKIHEVYVLERKAINEVEYKSISLDNNWGSLSSSIKQDSCLEPDLSLPQIPQSIEVRLNKQLKHIPYKH